MTVQLDHLIVRATERRTSGRFLGTVVGIEPARDNEPTTPLHVGDRSLDCMTTAIVVPQHYAYTVDNDRFDHAVAQLAVNNHPILSDPTHELPGVQQHSNGRRSCYLPEPDHHSIEPLTTTTTTSQ